MLKGHTALELKVDTDRLESFVHVDGGVLNKSQYDFVFTNLHVTGLVNKGLGANFSVAVHASPTYTETAVNLLMQVPQLLSYSTKDTPLELSEFALPLFDNTQRLGSVEEHDFHPICTVQGAGDEQLNSPDWRRWITVDHAGLFEELERQSQHQGPGLVKQNTLNYVWSDVDPSGKDLKDPGLYAVLKNLNALAARQGTPDRWNKWIATDHTGKRLVVTVQKSQVKEILDGVYQNIIRPHEFALSLPNLTVSLTPLGQDWETIRKNVAHDPAKFKVAGQSQPVTAPFMLYVSLSVFGYFIKTRKP